MEPERTVRQAACCSTLGEATLSHLEWQRDVISWESQSAERLSYVGDVAPRLAFLPAAMQKQRSTAYATVYCTPRTQDCLEQSEPPLFG